VVKESKAMATTATVRSSEISSARRFGLPQGIAGALVLVFMAQGLWLMLHTPVSAVEMLYSGTGELASATPPTVSSPLTVLAARAARLVFRISPAALWPVRLPFLLFGTALGASLWYVARRLHGNAGGYIALLLYTFSPTVITYSARVQSEMPAAWGVFGTVFTAIAVAHTLYAPREVVLWNWKRIVLRGMAIALGAGAQFSTIVAVLIGLGFMLYLVPERRGAATVIMTAAAMVGAVVLSAFHRLQLSTLAADVSRSGLDAFAPRTLVSWPAWRMLGLMLLHDGPGFMLLLCGSLVTFVAWRRTWFFGTLAPLLGAAALTVIGLAFPHAAGFSFLVSALPFLFVFIAGVGADLLQSRGASLALGIIAAALVMQAYFSLGGLWRMH
jgi:hypothetical protein